MRRAATRQGVVSLAAAVAILSLTSTASGKPLRTLVHVEATGDAENAALVVVTDAPANFTSFLRASPARAVIDFPEAGIAPTVSSSGKGSGDGAIGAWSLHTFESGTSSSTRLTIDLREGHDFTVHTDGTSLTVRAVPLVARPLVALVEPVAERVSPSAITPPFSPPAPIPPSPADGPAPSVAKEEEPEVATQIETEPADAGAQIEAPAVVVAKVDVEPAADVETIIGASAASSIEPYVQPIAPPLPREQAARLPERQEPSRPVVVAASASPVALERVGFRRTADGARLTLQTGEPVEYSLREVSPTRLVLQLEGTHIPVATNRLPLDTRFFGTAVTRVVPRIDHAARRVSIDIHLADATAYRARRDADELVVDFLSPRPDLSAELHGSGGGRP